MDAGLPVGEHQGIAALIGGERGVIRQQRFQVLDQLGGIGIADRDDLGHHRVGGRDLRRVGSLVHRQVVFAGLVLVDNLENPLVADDGVAFVRQQGVQQFHGVVGADGLIAPRVDFAFHVRFHDDDESGGLTHVVQHGFDVRPPKVELDGGILALSAGGAESGPDGECHGESWFDVFHGFH